MDVKTIKQQLFDRAFTGMRKQDFVQSTDSRRPDYKTCLYRGPTGLRCVIGQLIDDRTEAAWADGNGSVNDLFDIDAKRLFDAINSPRPDDQDDEGEVIHFLTELQNIHDGPVEGVVGSGTTTDMRKGLIETALEHGLTIPQ